MTLLSSSPARADLLPSDVPLRLVDETGTAVSPEQLPPLERLVAAHRAMVRGRRLDQQASALVRQGRLAVYPSSRGQEACQIGAVLALRDTDWLFPTYRESVALFTRGIEPAEVLSLLRGDWHSGYDPYAHRVAPQATPLATQALHAVGLAHAARLRGEDTVALAFLGDGATSEGDFTEALNFAAVFEAPVVFFVQNNGFAISVPLAQQTAAPSLAHKGIGFGMPGERVDGNDVAAVLAVLGDAVARARAGDGPTLVEAHTYRLEAHTNADDATRYRSAEEVEPWHARDPIARLEKLLRDRGVLDDEAVADAVATADRDAAALRTKLSADVAVDAEDLFRHVYARPTPALQEQAALLREELA
jgi:pyruvate dehydrogenase E1 component alpha subunit